MLSVEEAKRGEKAFPGRRNSMCKEFLSPQENLGSLRKDEEDKVPGSLQVKGRVA